MSFQSRANASPLPLKIFMESAIREISFLLTLCLLVFSHLFSFLKSLEKKRRKENKKEREREGEFVESSLCAPSLIIWKIQKFDIFLPYYHRSNDFWRKRQSVILEHSVYKWSGQNRSRRDSRFCRIELRIARIYMCTCVHIPALLYRKSAVNHCRRGVRDTGSRGVVGGLKLTR